MNFSIFHATAFVYVLQAFKQVKVIELSITIRQLK